MESHDTENRSSSQDKQLQDVSLEAVMEKRRLDQALNAKEFAVCAGLSYSTARNWFHLPGFPVLSGRVFWQDFLNWRAHRGDATAPVSHSPQSEVPASGTLNLPPRAAQILRDF